MKEVEVDKEGFMQNPDDWNKEIAAEIAGAAGISELTDRHWKVIEFMRTRVAETGAAPAAPGSGVFGTPGADGTSKGASGKSSSAASVTTKKPVAAGR